MIKKRSYKVSVPFPYYGNKLRFYKEIREIFINNKKNKFVDLFAGALGIPLSLKNEFKELEVLANVKDVRIENFLQYKNLIEFYDEMVNLLYEGKSLIDVRKLDKKDFEDMRIKFRSLFKNICPCCGKTMNKIQKELKYTEEEKNILALIFGFGGDNLSLNNSFYSSNKRENLKKYLEMAKTINITNDFFNEDLEFENSFIFLDPPYIQKTVKDTENNFIGYDYVENAGVYWSVKDDLRLIKFISNNLNKNNVFLVFGSIGNNLQKLLKENFVCEFIEKEYKHMTLGKATKRAEFFCLIK